MTNSWYEMTQRVAPTDTRIPVATYRAVIGVSVERSDFTIHPDVEQEVVVAALLKQPEWCPIPWPVSDDPTDRELRHLALLKIRLFFEFGARLQGETADEIHEALWLMFPDLRRASRGDLVEKRFKRYPVDATIWSDGEASGGYTHPGDGEHPPLGILTWNSLDLMIKNLVRADIHRLLDTEDKKWKSLS